jgi:enoyl-CoA hydratase/carnithine racemase
MTLRLEVEGRTGHLVIDRADQRNAFNLAMWQALPGVLEQAGRNPELRLLVVRSASGDGAFSAGADIKELLAHKDDAGWRSANQAAINRAQYELARHPLPTLALVEGDCIGGGCGLALACDLRVATGPDVRFGITPAKLGLVYPLHDVKLLVDLVGPGQARRLLYTGMLIDADEALRIGLIEEINPQPDELMEQLVNASPSSVRELKRFVRRVLDGNGVDDEESLRVFADAFQNLDFAEGTRAFLEKRKPEFR